jgi:hypothetical protein
MKWEKFLKTASTLLSRNETLIDFNQAKISVNTPHEKVKDLSFTLFNSIPMPVWGLMPVPILCAGAPSRERLFAGGVLSVREHRY